MATQENMKMNTVFEIIRWLWSLNNVLRENFSEFTVLINNISTHQQINSINVSIRDMKTQV